MARTLKLLQHLTAALQLKAIDRIPPEWRMNIPSAAANVQWVAPKGVTGVAYAIFTAPDALKELRAFVRKFSTRAKKRNIAWTYSFSSEGERERFVREDIQSEVLRAQHLRERRQNKPPHGLQVGDILVASWGYDQTNIDFAKVVEVLPKGVKIVEIGKSVRSSGSRGSDLVLPDPGHVIGRPLTRQVNSGGAVRGDSEFIRFYKWDGKPQFQTASGYGH